jgi:hypothetical protein
MVFLLSSISGMCPEDSLFPIVSSTFNRFALAPQVDYTILFEKPSCCFVENGIMGPYVVIWPVASVGTVA